MSEAFKETIAYIGKQLKSMPPKEDVARGEVELLIDKIRFLLRKGENEGTFVIESDLGFFLIKPQKGHLKRLVTGNFLGVDAGGCSLCFEKTGVTLTLKAVTSPGTSPKENWEWLHRIVSVYHHWNKELSTWSEFTPLTSLITDDKNGVRRSYPIRKDLRA